MSPLLSLIRQYPGLSAGQLAARLGTTEASIRRRLSDLQRDGVVERRVKKQEGYPRWYLAEDERCDTR